LAAALSLLSCGCPRAPGPGPTTAGSPATDPGDRDPAVAFAEGFVARLNADPDETLLGLIDLKASFLAAFCLWHPDGSDRMVCADAEGYEGVASDPAAAREHKLETLALIRSELKGDCRATGEAASVVREPEAVPTAKGPAGESLPVPAVRESYRRFIASVDREEIVVFRCADETVGLWVIKYKGSSDYRAHGSGKL
jgi:hypothetical protein